MALDLDRVRASSSPSASGSQAAIGERQPRGLAEEETGDLSIGTDDHIADSATETFMRELDDGLEENAEHLLEEIDAALARIEDGTYGTCAACGKPIAEERLEAVPWATLCIDDKRAQERG